MSTTDEAAAQFRSMLNDVHNVHWTKYHDDLRAILDERDALRERLEAAEKCIALVPWTPPPQADYVRAIEDYCKRFGGRDE